MEKMIGWMPRVWLKKKIDNAKLQTKTMYPFVALWEMLSFVSIIVMLMTSEQRSLKSMKSNVSLQLTSCDLHIFIGFPS